MTATVTADFREEFEAERTRLFRRRFLWYTGIFGAVGLLTALASFAGFAVVPEPLFAPLAWTVAITLLASLVYPAAFLYVLRAKHGLPREKMIKLTFWLLVSMGVLGIPTTVLGYNLGVAGTRAEAVKAAIEAEVRDADEPTRALLNARLGVIDAEGVTSDRAWDAMLASLPDAVAENARAVYTSKRGLNPGAGTSWFINVMIAHILAALFIPWTWREAVWPLLPLIGLNAVGVAISGELGTLTGLLYVGLSPLMGVPGVLIAAFRSRRFQSTFHYRMLRTRYGDFKRELGLARDIHEGLFPEPIREGPVRFEYVYEPMRHIGGDYLYARQSPGPPGAPPTSHIIIVDVTGHGVSAALLVNRLHGEIDRLLAEHPISSPARIMTSLNSYMNHTASGYSMYATAICLCARPSLDEVAWSSAGHPPAFLRAVDGTLHRLESTSIVLGACHAEDFEGEQRTMRFGPGDTIVAYTDGAIEARHHDGRLLGVRGLEKIIASGRPDARTGWAGMLLREVDGFRHGPSEDDVLMVEVFRPVEAPSDGPAVAARRQAAPAPFVAAPAPPRL